LAFRIFEIQCHATDSKFLSSYVNAFVILTLLTIHVFDIIIN